MSVTAGSGASGTVGGATGTAPDSAWRQVEAGVWECAFVGAGRGGRGGKAGGGVGQVGRRAADGDAWLGALRGFAVCVCGGGVERLVRCVLVRVCAGKQGGWGGGGGQRTQSKDVAVVVSRKEARRQGVRLRPHL